jgi:uncharacterized protein
MNISVKFIKVFTFIKPLFGYSCFLVQILKILTMEKMTNSINWFEIPVLNFDNAKEFYSRIYDYKMTESTSHSFRMGFLPMDPDSRGVGGAIVQGIGYTPTSLGVKIYLNGGRDLLTVLNRVIAAGGEIIVPKTKISDEIGYFAVFADTEGNHISLHSSD